MVSTFATFQVVGMTKKVHKTKKGVIASASGTIVGIQKFFRWLDEGMDEDAAVNCDSLDGIFIEPNGTVWHVDEDLFPYQFEAEFYSGGGGAQIALGAMGFGATAEEAVKVAVKLSLGTGGKLQKVTL